MVNIVFIALVVLAVFLFFKITSFRYERWWTYLIAIVLIFVLFSFFKVVNANQIDIDSFEGFMSGAKSYAFWLANFGKTTASITGQATLGWNVTNTTA